MKPLLADTVDTIIAAMRHEVEQDEFRVYQNAKAMPEVAAMYRFRAQSVKLWANTLEFAINEKPIRLPRGRTWVERTAGRCAWLVTFPVIAIAWYVLGACSMRILSKVMDKSARALSEYDW